MIEKQIWYDVLARQLSHHFRSVRKGHVGAAIHQHFVNTSKIREALLMCLNHLEAYAGQVADKIENEVKKLKDKAELQKKEFEELPWYQIKKRRIASYQLAETRFRIAALIDMHTMLRNMEPGDTFEKYQIAEGLEYERL